MGGADYWRSCHWYWQKPWKNWTTGCTEVAGRKWKSCHCQDFKPGALGTEHGSLLMGFHSRSNAGTQCSNITTKCRDGCKRLQNHCDCLIVCLPFFQRWHFCCSWLISCQFLGFDVSFLGHNDDNLKINTQPMLGRGKGRFIAQRGASTIADASAGHPHHCHRAGCIQPWLAAGGVGANLSAMDPSPQGCQVSVISNELMQQMSLMLMEGLASVHGRLEQKMTKAHEEIYVRMSEISEGLT